MVLLVVSLAAPLDPGVGVVALAPCSSMVDVALAGDHPVALVVIEVAAEDAIRPARSRRPIQRDVHIVQEDVPGLQLQFLRRLEREQRVSLAGLRVAEPVRGLLNVHSQTRRQVLFDVPEAIAPVNDEAGDEGQQQGRRHHNPPAQPLDRDTHTSFIFSLRAAPPFSERLWPPHSLRSVSAGSMRAIRSAGSRLAAAAIATRSSGTLTSVTGSYVPTP